MSLLLRLLTTATPAYAVDRSITLTTGIRSANGSLFPWMTVITNITAFVSMSAIGVCTVIFLIGAAQLVLSHGDQTKVDNGKKMMIGALIGLAIILGSYAIVRTLVYFLYVGTAGF